MNLSWEDTHVIQGHLKPKIQNVLARGSSTVFWNKTTLFKFLSKWIKCLPRWFGVNCHTAKYYKFGHRAKKSDHFLGDQFSVGCQLSIVDPIWGRKEGTALDMQHIAV